MRGEGRGSKEENPYQTGASEKALWAGESRESLEDMLLQVALSTCQPHSLRDAQVCQRGFRGRCWEGWRNQVCAMWGTARGRRNNSLKSLFEGLPWGKGFDLCAVSGSTALSQFLGKRTGTQKLFLEKEALSNPRPTWKRMRCFVRKWVYHYWKSSRTSWMTTCQRCDDN